MAATVGRGVWSECGLFGIVALDAPSPSIAIAP